ncbi:MAG: PQQ-dependent sugar dehydrogenase [Cyanobacteria bacterium CRU_2_1]|nr:PQQ-dependent sugar dehydrogenase [Cyanobacteria bacterium RU_5_0]NJR58795.1 PQQ-dependent sugar dehydrogenase [Cyanobacteria bacterium CRU_2_1]
MGDRSQFSLALINLTADAKVQLLNRSDSLIRTATGESGKSKFLNLTLEPGTYYVRVIPTRLTSKTRYTLNLAATPLSSEPLPALPAINLASRASGFNKPVHITSAKDGSNRLFVVEQDGRIRILQNGTVLNTPFLDIADRVRSAGEEGLLSVAFPPDYARKGYFYVYYTNSAGNNVVSRFRTTNTNVAAPNSEQVILTLNHPTFANHNGGQLAFGLDGYLYIGTGDGGGGGDPNNNAQNPNSLLGKILRIDVESPDTATYTIPTTNPFVGAKDLQNRVRDEIWALGLRNPWRFSFDRQTNDLFIADVGQNAYEEVNFQVGSSTGGENYGWRVLEGVHRFNNSTEDITGFVLPIAEYDHSQGESVTGGFVYRGTTESALRGVYFYGDFISGKLWGVRQNGSQWTNQLLLESPYLISSFGEDEQGNLYLTDYAGGGVYQITT